MKTTAIISEYNPFHNGHKYQIEKVKKNLDTNAIICIMSGNFTQRGELAIIDKYKRAEIALHNGANLVIELPFVYACSTAEIFASCAVKILNNLGIVDYLSFGMEDSSKLKDIDQIIKILSKEDKQYSQSLKKHLDSGKSYIESRQLSLQEMLNTDISFISKANNILAMEYIKQLNKLHSSIVPYPIRRTSSFKSLDSLDCFLSAYGIREKILNGEDYTNYIPINAIKEYSHVNKENIKILDNYFFTIKSMIMGMDKDDLYKYMDVEVGLNNRIYDNIFKFDKIEQFIDYTSTKRYTKNRIRRILTHILTNYTKEESIKFKNHTPAFIKVLAFDNTGRKLLKQIKDKDIKIFSNYNKDIYSLSKTDQEIIKKNIKVDNIYNLNYEKYNLDYYKQAFYLNR